MPPIAYRLTIDDLWSIWTELDFAVFASERDLEAARQRLERGVDALADAEELEQLIAAAALRRDRLVELRARVGDERMCRCLHERELREAAAA